MADTIITFRIPEAKAPEALAAFTAVHPNITGDPEQWKGAPLSDADWMRYCAQQWVDGIVNQGRKHLHRVNNPEPVDTKFAED